MGNWKGRLERRKADAQSAVIRGVQTSGQRRSRRDERRRYGITVEEFLQAKRMAEVEKEPRSRVSASYGEISEVATARSGPGFEGGW